QWHRLARNPILVETTSSKTEKVPPKPQHSSGCAGVPNSMPATFESRSIGLEKTCSRNSEGVACLSWRRVPQLLCSPTRCGKLARGNASTFIDVVQELDQVIVHPRTSITFEVSNGIHF